MPPWFVQENKWRSARYGMDAIIILDAHGEERLVTDAVERLLVQLAPVAERLGCAEELDSVRTILRKGASYQRQRAVARRNGGDSTRWSRRSSRRCARAARFDPRPLVAITE